MHGIKKIFKNSYLLHIIYTKYQRWSTRLSLHLFSNHVTSNHMRATLAGDKMREAEVRCVVVGIYQLVTRAQHAINGISDVQWRWLSHVALVIVWGSVWDGSGEEEDKGWYEVEPRRDNENKNKRELKANKKTNSLGDRTANRTGFFFLAFLFSFFDKRQYRKNGEMNNKATDNQLALANIISGFHVCICQR